MRGCIHWKVSFERRLAEASGNSGASSTDGRGGGTCDRENGLRNYGENRKIETNQGKAADQNLILFEVLRSFASSRSLDSTGVFPSVDSLESLGAMGGSGEANKQRRRSAVLNSSQCTANRSARFDRYSSGDDDSKNEDVQIAQLLLVRRQNCKGRWYRHEKG
jgi:hypothetical protein